jgi:mannosyl-oligosaccharide alpha-1,2-mannosidase
LRLFSDVNLALGGTGLGKQPVWVGDSSLSEVTSIQLEFRELGRLLGNDTYEREVLILIFVYFLHFRI